MSRLNSFIRGSVQVELLSTFYSKVNHRIINKVVCRVNPPPAIKSTFLMMALLFSSSLIITVNADLSYKDSESAQKTTPDTYFPGYGYHNWQRISPEEAGMDPVLINEAIELSKRSETSIPKQAELAIQQWRTGNEDTHRSIIGPVKDHDAGVNGMIIKDGYIVAEWGDVERVDMSYSVTKSFITLVMGVAMDRGLVDSEHDPVYKHIRGQDELDDFSSEHNRKVTWDHLLRMTSEWEGEVWGKPWHAEGRRNPRDLPLQEPGTFQVYSNVTSARLALAIMQVLRQPLPKVLRENVMDPIGASTTWRWKGYDNAWIEIDGQMMQGSSSGGGWGGSMWINTPDLARVGLLTLKQGEWDGKQLISREWFEKAETPTPIRDDRGFINWNLNTGRKAVPKAPETAFFHSGSGNRIYVDRENNLVVVIRWMQTGDAFREFIGKIIDSIE